MNATRLFVTVGLILLPRFLSSQTLKSGTTIVIYKSNDTVIVAADSRIFDSHAKTKNELVCKIHRVANTFYTVAGVIYELNTGFQIHDYIAAACRKGGSLESQVLNLKEIVSGPFSNALQTDFRMNRMSVFTPSSVASYNTDIVLFAVTDSGAHLARLTINRPFSGSMLYPLEAKTWSSVYGEKYLITLGHDDHIVRVQNNPEIWASGAIGAVQYLVRIEAEAHPNAVAPPIDVLLLSKSGSRWIRKKSNCPSIE